MPCNMSSCPHPRVCDPACFDYRTRSPIQTAIHKREKMKHLSVKKKQTNLSVKDTSRYELPITIEILFGKKYSERP